MRRRAGSALILVGLVGLGIWAGSNAHRMISQHQANRTLDRESAAAPKPFPKLRNGDLIGRLSIPRLGVRSVVREGTGTGTLDVAVGHIPGTALPGEFGNTALAGHRDTLFRALRNINKDDLLEFETPGGTYHYQVESTRIVKPDDVSVLRTGTYPEMTLVTCYPFYYVGSAPDRFIVKARLVDSPAPQNQHLVPANYQTNPIPPPKPGTKRVYFRLAEDHSRELIPGIRVGVVATHPALHSASVWMLMTPEQRTISLKNQPVHQPVFFHGHNDSKQRELVITSVTSKAVTGYLLLYAANRPAKSVQSE